MGNRWIAVASTLVIAPLLLVAGCSGGADGTPPTGSAGVIGAKLPNRLNRHPLMVRGAVMDLVSGYLPKQILHAYGFDESPADGSGQTVAIVDPYGSPTIAKDLVRFSTQFGLPAADLTIATPQGAPTTNSGWALETALDVEWVHAIAPKAKILLVACKSAYDSDLYAGVAYGAERAAQVSMSWGHDEFPGEEDALKPYFSQPGVSYIASAGESGGLPIVPSVLPQVLCVGGTTLNLDNAGNPLSETGWSGSNGGPSLYIRTPVWQKQWNKTTMRECPDVCCVADPATGVPVYNSTPVGGQRGWFQVGGTSLSAPIWAALVARVNSGRNWTLSGTNAAIYALGSPTRFKTYFRDITSGVNNRHSCQAGYDMVTGIGAPRANAMGAMQGQATGTVTDAAGKPLAGKTVTFRTQSGAIAWRGQTSARGRYCTASLDLDTYKVNCCGSLYGQCVIDQAVVTYNITCD